MPDFASLLEELAAAANRVEAAVRRVAPGQWHEPVHGGEGGWTRLQILAHLAAGDVRPLLRIRAATGLAMPADTAGQDVGLGVHQWNQARVAERAGRTVDELLAEMHDHRRQLIELLHNLTPEQRARPVRRAGGPASLTDTLRTVIGHQDGHARQIVGGNQRRTRAGS